MRPVLSVDAIFEKLLRLDDTLKLTDLRKDILRIIIQAKKPISAYEILNQLKQERDGAEPPTVYRVIEYFLEKHIIHKINAENKYVFCSQFESVMHHKHGFIFVCKKCLSANEISGQACIDLMRNLSESYQFSIDNSPIEVNGICLDCINAQISN